MITHASRISFNNPNNPHRLAVLSLQLMLLAARLVIVVVGLALAALGTANAQTCPGPNGITPVAENRPADLKPGLQVLLLPMRTSNGAFFSFSDFVKDGFGGIMPIDGTVMNRFPYSFGHRPTRQLVIHYLRGYYLACEDADHGFGLQIQAPETDGGRAMLCNAYLFIDDRRVARTGTDRSTLIFVNSGQTFSASGTVNLTKGLHKVDFAIGCGLQFYGMSSMTGIFDTANEAWAATSYRLLVRSGNGIPVPLQSERMFHSPSGS